jgi:maltokinase
MAELPPDLVRHIPAYLAAQRWFSGAVAPEHEAFRVESLAELWAADDGVHRMWQLIVSAGSHRYQLLLGERPAGEEAEFLRGREEAVLGAAGNAYFYDATLDSEMSRILLSVASDGREQATFARQLAAEQSNTSLVYDDRVILKVFRRLHSGPNPDVEVTTALTAAGFEYLARPLVSWRDDHFDLAFGQEFLAGGTEGWALAVTSLRDLYNGEARTPEEAGGDFAGDAERLGRVTAEMHLALHQVFGSAPTSEAADMWTQLVDSFVPRLHAASELAGVDLAGDGSSLVAGFRRAGDPGTYTRVHGDYHLGQVMRTDAGWRVLDFEGEPTKPLEERVRPNSPLKDVAGMVRSFHYAARHVLAEHRQTERDDLLPLAAAWEARNRQAFLDGYQEVVDIQAILPEPASAAVVLAAYELDKALYELDYEQAHRPEWVPISLDALDRLIHGSADEGP